MNDMQNFEDVFEHQKELTRKWNHLNIKSAGEMPIWHYMDANRFLSNLQQKTLNIGSLSSMDDQHEGSFPKITQKEIFWEGYSSKNSVWRHITEAPSLVNFLYIMCWTAQEEEHEGFWRAFTNLKHGVAIKTRLAKLDSAMHKVMSENSFKGLKIFSVKYVNFKAVDTYSNWQDLNFHDHHGAGHENVSNYKDGRLAFGNKYFPAQIKRHSFSHEREVRLVALKQDHVQQRLEFKLDWSDLIEDIYLSPKMSASDASSFKKQIANHLNCNVYESKCYAY